MEREECIKTGFYNKGKNKHMATKLTKQQAEEKVYQLTERLIKLKLDAKDTMTGYKDKMKDVESEIKAVIEEQNA